MRRSPGGMLRVLETVAPLQNRPVIPTTQSVRNEGTVKELEDPYLGVIKRLEILGSDVLEYVFGGGLHVGIRICYSGLGTFRWWLAHNTTGKLFLERILQGVGNGRCHCLDLGLALLLRLARRCGNGSRAFSHHGLNFFYCEPLLLALVVQLGRG